MSCCFYIYIIDRWYDFNWCISDYVIILSSPHSPKIIICINLMHLSSSSLFVVFVLCIKCLIHINRKDVLIINICRFIFEVFTNHRYFDCFRPSDEPQALLNFPSLFRLLCKIGRYLLKEFQTTTKPYIIQYRKATLFSNNVKLMQFNFIILRPLCIRYTRPSWFLRTCHRRSRSVIWSQN